MEKVLKHCRAAGNCSQVLYLSGFVTSDTFHIHSTHSQYTFTPHMYSTHTNVIICYLKRNILQGSIKIVNIKLINLSAQIAGKWMCKEGNIKVFSPL